MIRSRRFRGGTMDNEGWACNIDAGPESRQLSALWAPFYGTPTGMGIHHTYSVDILGRCGRNRLHRFGLMVNSLCVDISYSQSLRSYGLPGPRLPRHPCTPTPTGIFAPHSSSTRCAY